MRTGVTIVNFIYRTASRASNSKLAGLCDVWDMGKRLAGGNHRWLVSKLYLRMHQMARMPSFHPIFLPSS